MAMVASFTISVVAFWHVFHGSTLHFAGSPGSGCPVRTGGLVSISWGLTVDQLSGTMLLVVTGVGTLIHVYSASYMSHEDDFGYARYFAYLNLFVAAMLTLVLATTWS